jgi:hypothetical protein
MAKREKTVKCPQCQKRLTPQGLNGHLRFVHGIGAEAASTAVATAPRADTMDLLIQKMAELTKQSDNLGAVIEWQTSRAGIRRRIVELVKELSEVRKQKDAKDWDANFFGSAEEKEIFAALEQVERDLLNEMATLTTSLREYSDVESDDE